MSRVRSAVGVAGKLYASTLPRRFVPMSVVRAMAERFASRSQRTGHPHFERLEEFFSQLLMHTPLSGSEHEVARRAIVEQVLGMELVWRPWLMEAGSAAGVEYLRAAQDERRPLVLTFPHFGNLYGQFAVLRELGLDAWFIPSPHHYDESPGGFRGRSVVQTRRYIELLGPGHVVVPPGAFDRSMHVLNNGGAISIAFDIAGSLPTPFLGRIVGLASGPPRLALASDAIVVPMVVRRRRERPVLTFAPGLDSRDYSDEADLQAAIASVMEKWAVEEPASVLPLADQPGGPPLIHDHTAGPQPSPDSSSLSP